MGSSGDRTARKAGHARGGEGSSPEVCVSRRTEAAVLLPGVPAPSCFCSPPTAGSAPRPQGHAPIRATPTTPHPLPYCPAISSTTPIVPAPPTATATFPSVIGIRDHPTRAQVPFSSPTTRSALGSRPVPPFILLSPISLSGPWATCPSGPSPPTVLRPLAEHRPIILPRPPRPCPSIRPRLIFRPRPMLASIQFPVKMQCMCISICNYKRHKSKY